jgi:NADPH-dependent 2,4-dienoyl-CoA reductase/sulfur reductase-like enzyme
MKRRFEVVVVGAGPAGLAAAAELAQRGVDVALLDENPDTGGQVYRQPPADFLVRHEEFPGIRYQTGRRLIQGFNRLSDKIAVIPEAYIWGFFDDEYLAVSRGGEIELVEFEKLILCEGAMERSIPFPGWTLPGIMTVGGLQKLVVHQRMLPGKRFLLAGCSPLLLSTASRLVAAGAEFVGICEATRFYETLRLVPEILRRRTMWQETFSLLSALLRKPVKTFRPYAIVAAEGETRVRKAKIARLDENWRPVPSSEKQIEIDIIGLGFGFLPQARLARLCGCDSTYDSAQKYWRPKTDRFMRTSKPGIYAAGDSTGIGGADAAEVEGRIAGIHAASELGRTSQGARAVQIKDLSYERNRIEAYASLLNKVFAPRDGLYNILDENTVICRCESITAGEIIKGMKLGYRNINEMKRTRFAMGLCQGRTCESIVTQLMCQRGIPLEEIGSLNLRPPLTPIPLATLEGYINHPEMTPESLSNPL